MEAKCILDIVIYIAQRLVLVAVFLRQVALHTCFAGDFSVELVECSVSDFCDGV